MFTSLRRLTGRALLAAACLSGLGLSAAYAQQPPQINTVWYILLENRNFSSGTTGTNTDGGSVVLGNAAAPYINSLITPGNAVAQQVSWCSCYHHVLSNAAGNPPSIHPSEPNYLWMEAGSNFGVLNDNDPYGSGKSVQSIATYLAANPTVSGECLTGLLQNKGITWRSYQEGTNLANSNGLNFNNNGGTLTNNVLPSSLWTVPLASFSGSSNSYVNAYNGSHQYNFACKHDGSLFFPAVNGSTTTTPNNGTYPTNPFALNYAPLEQLTTDLANNTVAQYNVITPDQFNDMHTALSAGITYHGTHYTGDLAQVAQGDNFLSIIIPQIMASQAYQNNGCIVVWTDETEGSTPNNLNHTLTEFVISPLAKGNAYNSKLNYTHSSDINTMQKVFQVAANTPTGYLNDAANPSNPSTGASGVGVGTGTALDMSDLFQPGVIPASIPIMTQTPSGFILNRRTNVMTQTVTLTNVLSSDITAPVYLVVGNLSSNTHLLNATGTTVNNTPTGSPYVLVSSNGLAAGASTTVTLQFALPTAGSITDSVSATSTAGQP